MTEHDGTPELATILDTAIHLMAALRWAAQTKQPLPPLLDEASAAVAGDLQWWIEELARQGDVDALSAIVKQLG